MRWRLSRRQAGGVLIAMMSVAWPSATVADAEQPSGITAGDVSSDLPNDRTVSPMRFAYRHNGGNCYDTCSWISAEGRITEDTPADFEAFIEGGIRQTAISIYIDSPGGRLLPALELGRRIRELGLSTAVAKSVVPDGDSVTFTEKGTCLSACAYMFLGGVSRSIDGFGFSARSWDGLENARDRVLGYHGVSIDAEVMAGLVFEDAQQAGVPWSELEATGTRLYGMAEFSSGVIVEYLSELGIDARLLQAAIASGDGVDRLDMKFPSNGELAEFGVFPSQTEAFDPFTLQIVGNGVVAATLKRGVGMRQDRRATLRLLRLCEAPTPWLVYSIGIDNEEFADLTAVMSEPTHSQFSVGIGNAKRPGTEVTFLTPMLGSSDFAREVYTDYLRAAFDPEAILSANGAKVPSFVSEDAFTIFVPLAPTWRVLFEAGADIEWSFDPRMNMVPVLRHTFGPDDIHIAEHVNENCLSFDELARIRY